MSSDKLTVGMIGVGGFGGYRRSQMKASGRFQIAAVCDRSAEALANAAAEEQAVAYEDFEAMLKHPGLEAIVVSTGADTHARFALAAMARGLHVLVEKEGL